MADDFYSRRSPRADFHNYCEGDYFVTICTKDMTHYFGEIRNNEIEYTRIGNKALELLEILPKSFKDVVVPLYVVMPNHIHAIICIDTKESIKSETKRSRLSVVVGWFKQRVTMYARLNGLSFFWQPRYHDHIIRSAKDGNNISEYIQTNIQRWEDDCFHPSKKSAK